MPNFSPTTTSQGQAPVDDNSPDGVGVNTPDMSPKTLKPKRRAISDVEHLFLILTNLQEARRAQNEKNGRIAAKLNAERPYDDAKLESEGLGYKSNFSTKPLSTTCNKVASRLVKAVQSARYLTAAELPDSVPDARTKTDLFRSEITNLIRRWDGWFDFLNLIGSEDSIYGWTAAACLDETSWKPNPYRQDDFFVPDGTRNAVSSVQVVFMRRFVQMYELAEMIVDRDAADVAGWNIDNTVESINNARPPGIPAANASPYTDTRRYEDAIRESSVSLTLVNGAKQIELYDCFATEIDGQISHYIIDNNTRKLLFEKEDRYKKAAECLSLFSYEQGNGKLLASKGVGREVYEIAGALDRARNEAIDRLQMSGKIIVSGPEGQIDRFKLSIIGNVALIPEGFTISQTKIESGIKEFIELDQMLTALLDEIAGSVTPKQLPGERVTATQVNVFSEREEERRDERDTRFIMQLAIGPVGMMTRRAMSADSDDEDAKSVREKLLSRMSKEEFEHLVNMSPIRTIEDFTEAEAQRVVMFAQEHRGDPLYDQEKLQRRAATAVVSSEFAEDVLLPTPDPTVTAEQSRFQELENQLLVNLRPVPVSPRDNHLIHIDTLKAGLSLIAPQAVHGDQKALAIMPGFLKHWSDHLQAAEAGGVDKKQLAPMQQELQAVAKQLGEMQAHAQASAQSVQAGGQPLPPPAPGGGGPVPGPGPAPAPDTSPDGPPQA